MRVLLLTAYGITRDEDRELIDFCQTDSERERPYPLPAEPLPAGPGRWQSATGHHGHCGRRDRGPRHGLPGGPAATLLGAQTAQRRPKLHKDRQDGCPKQAKQIHRAANRSQATAHFRARQARSEAAEPAAVACLAEDSDAVVAAR